MPSISNVINVSVLAGGKLASTDNLNAVCIMQDERDLSNGKRTEVYKDLSAVANEFGTAGDLYRCASAFFATSPNPIGVGGHLVIGRWYKTDTAKNATQSVLTGAKLATNVLTQLQNYNSASFVIDVAGTPRIMSGLDFRNIATIDGVLSVLNTAIGSSRGTFVLKDNSLVLTTTNAGVVETLSYAYAHSSGSFIGALLGLSAGSGATIKQGADATTITAETLESALLACRAENKFYGVTATEAMPDAEVLTIATTAKAEGFIFYNVFSSPSNLEVNGTNQVWLAKTASQKNLRMLYSKAGNVSFSSAYMSRVHSVNFNGENTALSMHLKELPVATDDYTESELLKCQTVGLDVYTTIKQTPCVLTSGANDYVDNVYNLIGFRDSIQTELYNLLKATSTKIPQTIRGMAQVLSTCESVSRRFVRAGVLSPGVWSSPDSFGDPKAFKRSIEQEGYYWTHQPFSEQAQADREARKSPLVQGAVKFAGAIHSIDVIVNLNF
jgi:hypothetical protein